MRISYWSSDVCSSDLRYACLAEALGSARMDCLHAHAGKLVGDIVVCLGDRPHGLGADHLGIGGGEVELLVDDGFGGAEVNRDAREGDQIGRASCRESVCQYV